MTWHILDARAIWIQEFTAALNQLVPTLGWLPRFRWVGLADRGVVTVASSDPRFEGREFALQRGYARAPISWIADIGHQLTRTIGRADSDALTSPLVCTTPFYAPVAERWSGPVVYYLTDLTVAYRTVDPRQVRQLDRRLCERADLVCANSRRIAEYCTRDAGCDAGKIVMIPNATRAANVAGSPVFTPAEPPADLADLPRPLLGVIGNLADNTDWALLEEAVRRTPDCSWAFVGPTTMAIPNRDRRASRQRLMSVGGRVRFVGARPYGALRNYARAFDAAILPYRKHEPTFSGSCTRFYEHLAACRPMFGTRGFAELIEKQPLITLVDTADELAEALAALRRRGLRDGLEALRWRVSRTETWEARAQSMVTALRDVLSSRAGSRHELAGVAS